MLRHFIIFFLIGITNIVFAQNKISSLFQWDDNHRLTQRATYHIFENVYPVQLSLPIKNGKRTFPNKFILPRPSNQSLTINLTKRSETAYKNLTVWSGLALDERFKHLPQYQNVILVYNPATDKFAASFVLPEGEFQLLPTPDSKDDYWLVESNSDWECNILETEEMTLPQASLREGPDCDCLETDQNGFSPIDIFIGYSNSAAAVAGDVNAHAAMMVATVNQGLTNSLVNDVYMRLVGTGLTANNPGVVTSVLSDCLDWFATEIEATGADYVSAFQTLTGAPNEAGGWAGVGGFTSVNNIGQPAAFRHEIGHNGGGGHCPGDGSSLPYAHGYNNGNWRTHLCGNDVNFYSTPLVNDDMGNPIGDAATADMAQAFRDRAPSIINRMRHQIPYFVGDVCVDMPCRPRHFTNQNEVITQVQLNTINNTTAGWACANVVGYSDYSNTSTDLNIGSTYALTVTPNVSWASSRLNVWVDWNADGTFENDEHVIDLTGAGPWVENIIPPVGTPLGTKRLRIRLQFSLGYTPDPCNGTGFNGGETEDYSVNVLAALPVEFTHFSGSCESQQLLLNWSTASEKNNLGFEIQGSTDGREWQKIGWQPTLSSGNSMLPLFYQYEWSKLNMPYLRLKQIDEDARFSFSPIITNPCSSDREPGFIIYPNPIKDWLTIEKNADGLDDATFQIFNQSGQLISEQVLVNFSTEWNTQFLANGIYFYRILNSGQQIQQGKLVKIH